MHLRNLLANAFGKSFTASKVKIRFPELQGEEICQVDVQMAKEPLIVKVSNKSGQKVERFYVRNGNASHEIPLSEMNAYIRGRFSQ